MNVCVYICICQTFAPCMGVNNHLLMKKRVILRKECLFRDHFSTSRALFFPFILLISFEKKKRECGEHILCKDVCAYEIWRAGHDIMKIEDDCLTIFLFSCRVSLPSHVLRNFSIYFFLQSPLIISHSQSL